MNKNSLKSDIKDSGMFQINIVRELCYLENEIERKMKTI